MIGWLIDLLGEQACLPASEQASEWSEHEEDVEDAHTDNDDDGDNHSHIVGLVQARRNSSALAMELHLSCINPLTSDLNE